MKYPTLYTSRYNYKGLPAFDGVKVQISNGAPKWEVPYPLYVLKLLAPPYYIKWDENFRENYLNYLNGIGFEKISKTLRKVSEIHHGQSLVLLCWENVMEGKECHRRNFAEWWESHTGEKVLELETEIYNHLPQEVQKSAACENIQLKLF